MEEFGIIIYSVDDVIYSFKSDIYAFFDMVNCIKSKHDSKITILSYHYQTSFNKMMGKIIDENRIRLLKVEEDESEGYFDLNIENEERLKFAVI